MRWTYLIKNIVGFNEKCSQKLNCFNLNPLKLAFLGDAVFELYIRERLIFKYDEKLGNLNKRKNELACCKGQSQILDMIFSSLTEDETKVYKKGCNVKIKNFSKKSSIIDYRRATGLECLLGYLYINGNIERIEQILEKIHEL